MKASRKMKPIKALEKGCEAADEFIKSTFGLREYVVKSSDVRMRDDLSFVLTLEIVPNPILSVGIPKRKAK